MEERKQSRQFTYRVAFYDAEEMTKAPTSRSVSTVRVRATTVQRALTAAFAESGLESRRDWHVVSVAPILTEAEARRYQV